MSGPFDYEAFYLTADGTDACRQAIDELSKLKAWALERYNEALQAAFRQGGQARENPSRHPEVANWASELKAWRLKIAAAQAKLIVETGKERGGQAGTTKVTDGLVAELRSKLAEAEEEASRVRVNTVRLAEADRCDADLAMEIKADGLNQAAGITNKAAMKLEAALAAMDYDEKAALRERFAAELVPIAQLLAARSLGYRNGELQRTENGDDEQWRNLLAAVDRFDQAVNEFQMAEARLEPLKQITTGLHTVVQASRNTASAGAARSRSIFDVTTPADLPAMPMVISIGNSATNARRYGYNGRQDTHTADDGDEAGENNPLPKPARPQASQIRPAQRSSRPLYDANGEQAWTESDSEASEEETQSEPALPQRTETEQQWWDKYGARAKAVIAVPLPQAKLAKGIQPDEGEPGCWVHCARLKATGMQMAEQLRFTMKQFGFAVKRVLVEQAEALDGSSRMDPYGLVEFQSDREAERCRFIWDNEGDWGLTAYETDARGNKLSTRRKLHLTYSRHPMYGSHGGYDSGND